MFSNIVKKIPDHSKIDQLSEYFRWTGLAGYSKEQAKKNEIRKETDLLPVNKTALYTDIPTKITKENFDLVSDFIQNLNDCITPSAFPTVLKWAVMLPKFIERIPIAQKKTIDLAYFTKCFKNLLKVYV